MKPSLYMRGVLGTCWYNFTETIAYVVIHRKTPDNLAYTPKVKYGKEKQQFMNLCTRKDLNDEKKPLFIYIHGGGFISGITKMRDTYVANWADKGFFTASLAYTYAPKKVFPGQLQELLSGIDFIYDHKDEWNIDTSRIVISGESAGGYYIMFMTAIANDKTLIEKLGLTFKHADEFHIDAMVTNCGCYNLKALLDDEKEQSKFPDIKMMTTSFLGMPIDEAKAFLETEEGSLSIPKVFKGYPPTYVIYCCRDWLRYEAFDLMKTFDELEVPYKSFEGTGLIGNHAWPIATFVKKARFCFEDAFEFVSKYVDV
ncbi:MAG: alpha/beta hydrolase [Clostridia bacterium]|nr:alpha/beta hydrolase [Clostridia bacterium]